MGATGTAIADTVKLERSHIVYRDGNAWLEFYRQSTGNGELKSATGYRRDKVLLPLMKAAGCYTKSNVAHRFRDTAVDYWVSQGVALSEIAVMLGDTERIVERHYKTILGRQQQRLAQVSVREWEEAKAATV